jgi:acyl transferase domain-containing protein/3-hydroxymyristoyl/3-hydroxydecanoyl-(acyl carrier protein) dehydratase/1-acyl-sn-glycerol-3-phosphate acyltransferase
MPIAVVGRGSVLPGALDTGTLWQRILSRDDLTGPSTRAMWGLSPAAVCDDPREPAACARGGYVTGFDRVWSPDGFQVGADQLATLPEGWRWLLHATRQALREAGVDTPGPRAGLVLGSLGYATRTFADTAALRWCGDLDADSPALAGQYGAVTWTAAACGIDGPRFALDAACASGLYALKAACDLLESRRADLVIAAGLNAADDLFLHVGFTALSALSRTGRSSPLSTDADGLLPAEGAAVLVLKRLDDAVVSGDRIFGIVRGVGLSNDGRGSGLLHPATAGQQRAIRRAYDGTGLSPTDIQLLECHATGTLVGDREEILSVRAVFGEAHQMAIGSLKAQLGHLITASGTAGVLKLLGAFEHAQRPPAPLVSLTHPIEALQGCGLQLHDSADTWTPGRAPRRAAINAFGFGGCNAHAILEGPEGVDDLCPAPRTRPAQRRNAAASAGAPTPLPAIALVACELSIGSASDTTAVLRALLSRDAATRRTGTIDLALKGLGFPPADLQQTLPQQVLLLRAAQVLRPHLEDIDRDRIGVFVGTDVDPAGARHGCRWRLSHYLGRSASDAERDAVVMPLQAAGVLGTMPNMPANRLNSALDARGPGMVVSAGRASGTEALRMAADALGRGDIDAALVGAVDASGGAFGDDPSLADTCVVWVVMRAGDTGTRDILSTLTPAPADSDTGIVAVPWADGGHAQTLLQLSTAALCCRHALWPDDPKQPWVGADRVLTLHGWRVEAARVQGLAEDVPALPAPDEASQATSRTTPGELGWVFTGAAAAYPGAGRTLLRALPAVADDLRTMAPRLAASLPSLLAQPALSLIDQLQLATLVSQSHALLLTRLGVVPDACLGLSSGETNAIMATRAWTDPDDLFSDVRSSGMYDRHLAGHYQTLRTSWNIPDEAPVSWRCYRLTHPVEALEAEVAKYPRVRVLIEHHERDAVIGGDESQCLAVIEALRASAVPIQHDLLVHCPELDPFAETWYDVHHRTTRSFTTPRLYANAIHRAYEPSADTCATMLTTQARSLVRFHPTIEQAYADGVRTFLELGPRAACTAWIDHILKGRAHESAALDGSRGTLHEAADALATVAAAGHRVNLDAWRALLADIRVLSPGDHGRPRTATIRIHGHLPQPVFHGPGGYEALVPAPQLVPALDARLHPVASAAVEPIVLPATDGPWFVESVDMTHPSAALHALATVQQGLLQVQQLAVSYLHALPLTSALHPTVLSLPAPAEPATHGHADPTAADAAGGHIAAVMAPAPETAPTRRAGMPPPGTLTFTREQLAIHAGGTISEIFGPQFIPQDRNRRQVRMPMDPLLLADRVTGMVGEPASMKTGTVWTETDVRPDSWYLYDNRMPTGIMIESGQADLFLISWLGIDLLDRGERVYRLLGCELTFHGGLPTVGDTLRYEIHIDSHARHGDIGLFFFHYDCRIDDQVRLSVRHGQAGFFTDEELAESAGVLWDPADDVPAADAPLDGPRQGVMPAEAYDADRVQAFAQGRLVDAFGPAFVRGASHTRTPRIPDGPMRLFDRVEAFDLHGGPWGRGYMRAVLDISPDQWFFPGHFKNDPCMPGTLMFEGCLQTMAFYMAALGYTIEHDGWRFEPVQGRPYLLRCRGQVTPKATSVIYEVFVAEVSSGPEPMLIADLMCTVDGLRAFHCRRMALRLTPDNPFGPRELAAVPADREPVAEHNGFRYGQASLLACANGDPVEAFGALYATLPPTRRVPRLPAPPYHFISRVTSLSHPPGGMDAGVVVETAYDIPPDAWYFAAHPTGQMPVCVLVEAALQPCGWLASYVGCAVHERDEVFFRNLDGAGTLHRALRHDDGCLRVKSRLKSLARAGGMTLVSFDVTCHVGDELIYELATAFGFFPKAALEGQAGLTATDEERALADARSGVDLLVGLDGAAKACLPNDTLRMCERVTERRRSADGHTWLRGEKTVRADEWFFRSHFFQDPVQPGSLGVEALVQLLQAHLLLEGAVEAMPGGEFADMVSGDRGIWQFRGQVLPESQLVSLTLSAQPIEKGADRWTVEAEGSVWVDGRRIYSLRGLRVSFLRPSQDRSRMHRLDPESQPWWNDHRPTFADPVLPGMAMVSLALDSAPDAVGVDDLTLRRWLVLDAPRSLATSRDGAQVTITEGGRPLADGQLCLEAGPAPRVVPALPKQAAPLGDPYASGAMFHGPAYHRVVSGRRSSAGADLTLTIDPVADRRERVSHIVLDAALHGVPHDAMSVWFPDVAEGQVAYPARIERFRLYSPLPSSGTVEVRVRPDGVWGHPRFPRVYVQWIHKGRVLADLRLVEACFPATRLGTLPAADRLAFLRDGRYVPGARLSDTDGTTTTLSAEAIASADWVPGTVRALYGLAADDAPVAAVATREHAALRLEAHPRDLSVTPDGRVSSPCFPLLDYRVHVSTTGQSASVHDAAPPALDVARIERWWDAARWQSREPSLQPLFLEASRQFVQRIRLIDPAAIAALYGRPLLLVANHQVAVESVLAGTVLPAVIGRPLLTLAKREHRDTWVGRLAMGLNDDRHGPAIVYVDRDRKEDMAERVADMAAAAMSGQRSLMVHVEGTRATHGRQPVGKTSSVWADLALSAGLTIVPLRYCGGLPVSGTEARLEFPSGMGGQTLVLGRPIPHEAFAQLPLAARRDRILQGLAELEAFDHDPTGDVTFASRVSSACARWGLDEVRAVFLLLQAAAQGWTLDADGLPGDAVSRRAGGGAFWEWFSA